MVNRTASRGSTVDISEDWLKGYRLPGGVDRERHWDEALTGFGVIIGRRRVSFVVQRRIDGEQHLRTLGQWAPSKLRATDAGVRAKTMSVLQARDKAIQALGTMRSGADPRTNRAPGSSPTLREAFELHLARMDKKGAQPRGIDTIEREVDKHLVNWLPRPYHSRPISPERRLRACTNHQRSRRHSRTPPPRPPLTTSTIARSPRAHPSAACSGR